MATKSVSFRVDETLLAQVDALRQPSKDRSAVLLELVRLGLATKQGQAEDATATTLAELLTEVKRLRARLKKNSPSQDLDTALETVAEKLLELVTEQQGRALDIITKELTALRQHVRRSFGNTLRIAFKLSEDEAKEHVRRTFDT